jgi:hypothetical protein
MKKLGLLVVWVTLVWGCQKDLRLEEELPISHLASINNEPGFGETDGKPQGLPFTLPRGLRLVERPNLPFDPDIKKLYGHINTFYFDVNLVRDSTWHGENLVFPPGLVVVSTGEGRMQNGLLIERVILPVPPYKVNTSNDTLTYYLGVACINEKKAFPWENNTDEDIKNYPIGKGMYKPEVITTNPTVLQFLSLLEGQEQLRLKAHHNPWEQFDEGYVRPAWLTPYDVIQEKLWKLTDGKGLTQKDLEELMHVLS